MKIVPKWDRVLIKRDTMKDELKASRILIPESVDKGNLSETGTVLAVGPTAGIWKDDRLIEGLSVGSKVIFARHAGVLVKGYEEEHLWLIQDTDVHAVIED